MSRMKLLMVLIIVVAGLGFSQLVSADVITTKDGKTLAGEIASTVGDFVVIVDEYGIEYKVAKSNIEGIVFGFADTGSSTGPKEEKPEQIQQGSAVEIEPNNQFRYATLINSNTTVTGAISPKGDRDYYKIWVDKPGVLNISVTGKQPGSLPSIRLVNQENSGITSWVDAPEGSSTATSSVDVSYGDCPLYLYAEIRHGRDNMEMDYTMEVKLQVINDVYETNNSFSQGRKAEINQEVTGYIFPNGDRDWFYYEVDQPGQLELFLSSPDPAVKPSIRIVNKDNSGITSWIDAEDFGKTAAGRIDLAGSEKIYIEVRNSQGDRRSLQPYTLKNVFTPVVDEYGPNKTFSQAAQIGVNDTVSAYIFPVGDHDWYEVNPTQMGFLTFEVICDDPAMPMRLRVISDENTGITSWISAEDAFEPAKHTIQALPGAYFLEIAQKSDNRRSIMPYKLKVTLEEVADAYEPNDRFYQAVQARIGTPIQATIFPAGDRDWFYFTLDSIRDVKIEAAGGSPLQMSVRLMDANNSSITSWVNAAEPGGSGTIQRSLDEGVYYVEVRHSADNMARNQPYTLTITTK